MILTKPQTAVQGGSYSRDIFTIAGNPKDITDYYAIVLRSTTGRRGSFFFYALQGRVQLS